jgi:hypothetical protein
VVNGGKKTLGERELKLPEALLEFRDPIKEGSEGWEWLE